MAATGIKKYLIQVEKELKNGVLIKNFRNVIIFGILVSLTVMLSLMNGLLFIAFNFAFLFLFGYHFWRLTNRLITYNDYDFAYLFFVLQLGALYVLFLALVLFIDSQMPRGFRPHYIDTIFN